MKMNRIKRFQACLLMVALQGVCAVSRADEIDVSLGPKKILIDQNGLEYQIGRKFIIHNEGGCAHVQPGTVMTVSDVLLVTDPTWRKSKYHHYVVELSGTNTDIFRITCSDSDSHAGKKLTCHSEGCNYSYTEIPAALTDSKKACPVDKQGK